MHLGFALLADAAVATPDGKIGVLGGNFDTIYAPSAPVQVLMALAVNLRIQPSECGRAHNLRIEFWDSDGNAILPPMELPFTPQRALNRAHRPVNMNLVANLQGLEIPRLGDYAFHILVDDIEMGVVPLYVEQPAGASGTSLALPDAGAT